MSLIIVISCCRFFSILPLSLFGLFIDMKSTNTLNRRRESSTWAQTGNMKESTPSRIKHCILSTQHVEILTRYRKICRIAKKILILFNRNRKDKRNWKGGLSAIFFSFSFQCFYCFEMVNDVVCLWKFHFCLRRLCFFLSFRSFWVFSVLHLFATLFVFSFWFFFLILSCDRFSLWLGCRFVRQFSYRKNKITMAKQKQE